jgi:hypothetical protein
VIAKGLSEAQQREFIVKDNLGYGEWDWEMLANDWDMDELNHWGLKADRWGGIDEPEQVEGEDEGEDREYKKNLMIHMKDEDYDEAMELMAWHRRRGAYIGGIVLKHLKAEKNKINL